MTKIYIYGLCDVYYDAFYIKGLKEFYNVNKVIFNCDKFPKFHQGTFAAIIQQDNNEFKICIDSRDQSDLWLEPLDWCTVYGKVNYNKNSLPEKNQNKVMAIGPSFGIKIWNSPKTIALSVLNFLRFRKQISNNKVFISNYLSQSKRVYLEEYYKAPIRNKSNKKYVFTACTLWKKENNTNKFRANFIKACLSNNEIEFEGGFVPRSDGNNLGYDNLLTAKIFNTKEYLSKTINSQLVFNTPAVLNCHGWKLGEFLAMGKAIISTSFCNEMPVNVIDGKDIVFLEHGTENEMDVKIRALFKSESKLLDLQNNAKNYFQNYLHPKKVIERLHKSVLND